MDAVTPTMLRMLAIATALVSLGETLTIHWLSLVTRGVGLSLGRGLGLFLVLAALNALVCSLIRV